MSKLSTIGITIGLILTMTAQTLGFNIVGLLVIICIMFYNRDSLI